MDVLLHSLHVLLEGQCVSDLTERIDLPCDHCNGEDNEGQGRDQVFEEEPVVGRLLKNLLILGCSDDT